MLAPDGIRTELMAIAASTSKPVNVDFFVHKPPPRDSAREASWRQVFAPYFAEYGIEPAAIADGPARMRSRGVVTVQAGDAAQESRLFRNECRGATTMGRRARFLPTVGSMRRARPSMRTSR